MPCFIVAGEIDQYYSTRNDTHQVGASVLLILLIFAAVPTAPSSTALAAETGGDVPVMNAVVTLQSALAFITLPITLAVGTMWLGG